MFFSCKDARSRDRDLQSLTLSSFGGSLLKQKRAQKHPLRRRKKK